MAKREQFWILQGKLAVPVATVGEWGRFFGSNARHVAVTQVGGIRISTVFLGIDHQFGDGPPLLFETMAFRGGSGEDCLRCSTWEQAEAQHNEMIAKVRTEIKQKVND